MDAIIDAIVEEWGTILKIMAIIGVAAIAAVWIWGAIFPAQQTTPPSEFPESVAPINGASTATVNATVTPIVTPTPAPFPKWTGVTIDYDKNVVRMDVNTYYANGGTDIMVTESQYNSGPYMPIYAKITNGNRTYEWLENQGGFDPVHGLVASTFVEHPLQDQIDMFNSNRLM